MPAEPGSGSARQAARSDMASMMEAASRLRDDLERHQSIIQEIIDDLGDRAALGTTLERVRAAQCRLDLTRSLAAYEASRHRARLSLIAVGVEEGMTLAEVAGHWGISRQLAGRYLRDIQRTD